METNWRSLTIDDSTIPNAEAHFIAGDMARWSGIKRCGGAMHMGYHAAINIHQLILAGLQPGYKPSFLELGEFDARMGLAIGTKAVAVAAGGPVASGEDVMEVYFGDNLGLSSEFCPLLLSLFFSYSG